MNPVIFEDIKRRMPPKELLINEAPLEVWYKAINQARRSKNKRHRTGCAIYATNNGAILASGVSQTHNGGLKVRTIHAEMDALAHLYAPIHKRVKLNAVIVTLTRSNNFALVSKPCTNCAKNLRSTISNVIFAEQANDGSWVVINSNPYDLSNLKLTRYAS